MSDDNTNTQAPSGESQTPVQKEFNDLLIALGVTSQENLRDAELAMVSRGYRRWLSAGSAPTQNCIKPKQYWYGVFQVSAPGGSVQVAMFTSDQHPLSLCAQAKLPYGGTLSFFAEITEQQFNEYNDAAQRPRIAP